MAMFDCPTCGKPAVKHWEKIPVRRSVLWIEGDEISIEGLIEEKDYESGEDECLSCEDGHEFPIPKKAKVGFA